MSDGHDELEGARDRMEGADAHCTDAHTYPSEFRSAVMMAIKNLAFRVLTLEQALEAAEETIARLEGK